jgi:hypothetical protein
LTRCVDRHGLAREPGHSPRAQLTSRRVVSQESRAGTDHSTNKGIPSEHEHQPQETQCTQSLLVTRSTTRSFYRVATAERRSEAPSLKGTSRFPFPDRAEALVATHLWADGTRCLCGRVAARPLGCLLGGGHAATLGTLHAPPPKCSATTPRTTTTSHQLRPTVEKEPWGHTRRNNRP